MQDECSLEPELYERAEKLFQVLLHYVTEFLVWEENLELSAELQPRYVLSDYMQMHKSTCKSLSLTLSVSLSILAGQKMMHTTVCCTMMSTTRTTMWFTPCSARSTVMKLKHRHTQHLLIKRYSFVLFDIYFIYLMTLSCRVIKNIDTCSTPRLKCYDQGESYLKKTSEQHDLWTVSISVSSCAVYWQAHSSTSETQRAVLSDIASKTRALCLFYKHVPGKATVNTPGWCWCRFWSAPKYELRVL